ncbi:hypothetical protein TP2_17500 [Thioclava pacifica DSM 10166]|uniref:Uncharacterized protein n=1 Tax=Thioclava pacifica DSM 10166 TaxID=1353537 RepID=A0A074JFM9_9RHOB|nr:hypothetical protein TP2_17500 [Thioclava pacifica DSM 10166]
MAFTAWRGSNGRPFVHGSVLVERHFSKSNELGLGVAIDPREWSIFGKMAASNPRRVGLHEMVMGVSVGAGTLP